MPRISRKELKKDEFATEISKTYEFFQQQRDRIIRYAVIAVVVVLAVVAGQFIVQNRRAKANDALTQAFRAYYGPSQGAIDVTYPDDNARYTAAETQFAAIAGKYWWLTEGRIARYYQALSELQLGKRDEAIRQLRMVADKGDSRYSSLATFALAGLYADAGKMAEAEKLYRELAAKPTETVPKESALLALADHLSATKPAESQKIYQEIKKEAPKSVAADEAERRLAEFKK